MTNGPVQISGLSVNDDWIQRSRDSAGDQVKYQFFCGSEIEGTSCRRRRHHGGRGVTAKRKGGILFALLQVCSTLDNP